MEKLFNANVVQFEQTTIRPMNDDAYIMRTKISDDFYIYQSFGYYLDPKYGDERIKPFVSFISDGGNGICAEWEPQYGPIQIWRKCDKNWKGKTKLENPISPRKHWHYEYVEDNNCEWSQLAVDENGLKKMLGTGNLNGIKNVLLEWCEK